MQGLLLVSTKTVNLLVIMPKQGPGEDFAESWAAQFFQGSWENIGSGGNGFAPRNPGGLDRRKAIAQEVAAFQLNVDSNVKFRADFELNPYAVGYGMTQ